MFLSSQVTSKFTIAQNPKAGLEECSYIENNIKQHYTQTCKEVK